MTRRLPQVMKIREPQPDAFGDLDPSAKTSYDVLFDTGRRENCDAQRVRIAAKCKVRSRACGFGGQFWRPSFAYLPPLCQTCGRAKGTVPSWESGNDLVTAVKRGNLPTAIQMAESGADLETRSLNGETPIMLAASGGWHLVVRYLLSQRVDTLHCNQEGASALALASAKGHTECVRALLEVSPENCAVKDGLGRTPLALAAAGGYAQCVALLCAADRHQVNEADNQGFSPFFKV